jgi:hypothetical protein
MGYVNFISIILFKMLLIEVWFDIFLILNIRCTNTTTKSNQCNILPNLLNGFLVQVSLFKNKLFEEFFLYIAYKFVIINCIYYIVVNF